jgi:deoxyribodipyrimidine photo-lyase
MPVRQQRIMTLVKGEAKRGPVIYWMSRDQRVKDNWALIFAQELANKLGQPMAVAFCLAPEFLGAACRQYHFMLKGLREVERDLKELEILFLLTAGDPGEKIPEIMDGYNAGALVSDFSPLRINGSWKRSVAAQIEVPFYEVDAHNIVPCWLASSKQEWAAYTFRPKIRRLLAEFLEEFPAPQRNRYSWKGMVENDWKAAELGIRADPIPDAGWNEPGERAAGRCLAQFLTDKLSRYDLDRNDPSLEGQSNLSPYLHFGQISAQRVAIQALASREDASSFLEELIVRRELSDNFCYYNSYYDSCRGFPDWAKETLTKHEKDQREYIYTLQEMEAARTHDPLWNAAQLEMVHRGKMHGYLRMYWAKKILEWTPSPEEALRSTIHLNDRYELDGRDPNGYAGIAWSIGGVHDRAWKERGVFGKVRYMSLKGAMAKFDVKGYIEKVESFIRAR